MLLAKINMSSLVFVTFATVFIVFGILSVHSSASAAGCVNGPATGVCKDVCTVDEVDGNILILTLPDTFTPGNCPNQICCVPKGQALCGGIASAAKVPQSQGFSCQKPCTGTPLSKYVPQVLETCLGDTICCDTRTGVAVVTPSSTKAPSVGSSIKLTNPLGEGATIYTILQRVISAFLGIVGSLALLVFVWAGILWMTGGSSDRVQQAKDMMKYAVIGLAMIAFAYVITSTFVDVLLGNLGSAPPSTEQQNANIATPPPPNP